MAKSKEVNKEEVVEQKRFFLGKDEKTKYFIVPPNASAIREADWQYSRIYTKSLTEGITTSAEMMDILRRRGIVGPEFEQRAAELATSLNEKILSLGVSDNLDEKRDLAVEVSEARDELFQWNQRLNGPMANTCEQLADDSRLEYLTSCMIVDKDNNRIWESYEEYIHETDQTLGLKSRFEIMLYLQGLEPDFLEKTPEAVAMKEVETDILNKAAEAAKALEAIQKEQEEPPIKEVAKKKITRKRKSEKSE